jgi:membrane associated rhomboid family serine protease
MIPLRDDNPTALKPLVTVTFIVACSLAFLWQLTLSENALQAALLGLGVTPATLIGGETLPPELYRVPPSLTVLTSMFLHGGWMHLIGNMLYLWIFGNNVEDAMGHGHFVVFYVLCGVVAALAQALPNAESTIPMIGASGAISGVLGAYLLLYPHARVLVLLPLGFYSRLIQMPAMFVLGFWFVLQLISSALTPAGAGGVAWGAHIGGFLAGMALIPLFKHRGVRLFAPPHRHDLD